MKLTIVSFLLEVPNSVKSEIVKFKTINRLPIIYEDSMLIDSD
jgi:hypothetical protein